MTTISTLAIVLSLASGFIVGLAYFGLLYRTVQMHVGHGSAFSIVGLYVLRLGLVGLVFWLLAQHGALSLLIGFGGFLMARFAVRRFVGA